MHNAVLVHVFQSLACLTHVVDHLRLRHLVVLCSNAVKQLPSRKAGKWIEMLVFKVKNKQTTTTTTATTKHNKIALWLPVYVDKTIFELIRFGRPQSDRLLVDMLCPVNCEGQTRVKYKSSNQTESLIYCAWYTTLYIWRGWWKN